MNTVTLIDGREVASDGEEWRAECEARAVCRLPNKFRRNEYMLRVKDRRGEAAHGALWDLVLQVWNAEFCPK